MTLLRRNLFAACVGSLLLLAGFASGIATVENLLIVTRDVTAPGILFSAEQPLPIPSLPALAAGASTDVDALRAVTVYYDTHTALLGTLFQETNAARLRALFALYTVSTSTLFGRVNRYPQTFTDYLRLRYADCAAYAWAQARLLSALGVRWRMIEISGGTHEFVEASVDGRWEVFDATVNLWADTSAESMFAGGVRHVRLFYTPLLDARYARAYASADLQAGQALRTDMPLLGAGYWPKAVLVVVDESGDND